MSGAEILCTWFSSSELISKKKLIKKILYDIIIDFSLFLLFLSYCRNFLIVTDLNTFLKMN